MTVDLHAGASSDKAPDWQAVNWPKVQRDVRRLQLRIAKAIRARKYGKAKALSWLLTHSRSAKLLAVKRVTENKGSKTPGVDKVPAVGTGHYHFAGTTFPRRTARCAR